MSKINLFIILTFVLSWGGIGIFYYLGYRIGSAEYQIMATGVMFVPGISAFVVQKLIYKEDVIGPFDLHVRFNKWTVIAWVLPVLIAGIAIVIALFFPSVHFDPQMGGYYQHISKILSADQLAQIKEINSKMPVHPVVVSLVGGMLAGITLNALVAAGEEIGWRGFLFNEFKSKGNFSASMLTGLIWGMWHAPLILMGHNYPDHPIAGVFMMIGFCLLLSPILCFITIKARSVWAAAILHGTINGTGSVAIMMLSGGNDMVVGLTGVAGLSALLFIIAIMMDYENNLSPEDEPTFSKSE